MRFFGFGGMDQSIGKHANEIHEVFDGNKGLYSKLLHPHGRSLIRKHVGEDTCRENLATCVIGENKTIIRIKLCNKGPAKVRQTK
jgi:hypothetical protein